MERFLGKNIVVTDSGIGGLTVLNKIANEIAFDNLYYYGDGENMPYGNKSFRRLQQIAFDNFKLFETLKANCVVVACNTLSTVITSKITELFNFKFFGVYPPVYREIVSGKKSVLVATEKTCSFYNKEIRTMPLANFATDIENNIFNLSKIDIEKYFYNFPKDCNGAILGCTHYVYLENQIKDFLKVLITSCNDYTVKIISNYLSQPLFSKKFANLDHRNKNFDHFDHKNLKTCEFYLKNGENKGKCIVFVGFCCEKYKEIFSKFY